MKRSQLDKAIQQLDSEIAILQAVKARMVAQQTVKKPKTKASLHNPLDPLTPTGIVFDKV